MAPELTYRECLTCHREFTVLKKRTKQPGRGLYCKPECAPQRQLGEANVTYRHGVESHTRGYKKANPAKRAAHEAVALALRRGTLTKPDHCEGCGQRKRLDGHHDDYSLQLVVRWLCRGCHLRVHGINRHSNRLTKARKPAHTDETQIVANKGLGSRWDRTSDSLLKRRMAD